MAGLICKDCSRFKVMTAWGTRTSQQVEGNSGSVLLTILIKGFLKVSIACYTMVSWGGKLVHKLFGFNAGNQFFGDLVVQAKELGAKTALLQVVMAMFEPFDQFRRGSVLDGQSVNEIDIGIKRNKHIFVAPELGGRITAGEVSGNQILEFFARSGVDDVNVDMTCATGR